ncbi:flavoprotein [Aspergillus oleicola]
MTRISRHLLPYATPTISPICPSSICRSTVLTLTQRRLITSYSLPSPTQPHKPPLPTTPLPTYTPPRPTRLVIGITGATGTIYAIHLLTTLRYLGIETHLIISKWALATLKYETSLSESQIRSLAHKNYTSRDLSAPIASGSFQHDGMIIVPCSMKTLAAVRIGLGDDLIARAADVSLKEGRKVMMVVRETPLSEIHLENMLWVRRAGVVVFPPVPAFYTRPRSLDDVIRQSVGRMLDSMGIYVEGFERWEGFRRDKEGEKGVEEGVVGGLG